MPGYMHARTLSRICSTSSGVMGPMYVLSAVPGSVMMVACTKRSY